MSTGPAVELSDVTIRFAGPGGGRILYSGVRATIGAGELVCIVGPSGSGKSVLLGLLLGDLAERAFVSGSVRVFGAEVSRRYPTAVLRRVGVVFQQDALFEDLSVRGNVAFALGHGGRGRAGRVTELLRQVGLEDVDQEVAQLSGGQRKRLALARTLAAEPDLILFDEPTSGLDPARSRQIAALIAETHAAAVRQRTTLIVTHDLEAVLPIAQRVLYVDAAARGLREVSAVEAARLLIEAGRSVAPEVASRGRLWAGLTERMLLALRACGAPLVPLVQFVVEPLPSSLRQLAARLRECLLGPAAFIASASLLIGALATFFALENNPLRGTMDRPVLVGLGKVLVAVVAPLCAGCLFAARIGAGETARLGHLRYSRQVDALRSFGRHRTTYLQAPLLWACMLALPVLTLGSAVLCSLASQVCAGQIRPIGPHAWASPYFSEIAAEDLPWLLLKCLGSGLIVGLTALRHGLAPKASAEDISDAVTAAIVSASLGVILWQSALTVLQFH